ncbi:hypothetical protein CYMTET_31429 [Cymbomonas tetramitiformis]|uniref:Uncharacterized protein n=1 Tax=Cymbomonas tetramitiformis TaxID=36881 RepID=A0AAE0FH22_9CHLO|nr:hypothetical protein CYMTET_31429 [Cymbomonas tetramitiformis]|eukprot:gene24151-29312_t
MRPGLAIVAFWAVLAEFSISYGSYGMVDMDGDGLDDDFEMTCAQRFKPVVYLAQKEEFGPITVDTFLQSCYLRKYGTCGHGGLSSVNISDTAGFCLWETAVSTRYAPCGFKDPDTTLGPCTPATLASEASAQCGGADGCYIRCLGCQETGKCENLGLDQPDAKGTHGAEALKNIPFYVHVFRDTGGTVQIQYWFFYAFNGPTDGFGTHQGDWEHFSIRADAKCLTRLAYVPFAHGTPPPWSNATMGEEGGHAVVYSAINSHATYLTVGTQPGGTPITHDHTSKGERWFPDSLINAGETTCAQSGRRPMRDDTKWVDFTDVWGSNSAFDGSLNNGACDSGPHLQWNEQMPDSFCK